MSTNSIPHLYYELSTNGPSAEAGLTQPAQTQAATQPLTIDHLHIRRIGDTIMIHHEDGRRLGFVNAATGQCRDARRGENVVGWLNGVGLTVQGVIEMTQPADAIAFTCTPDDPFDGTDPRICQTCHGDGWMRSCATCHGTGLAQPAVTPATNDSPSQEPAPQAVPTRRLGVTTFIDVISMNDLAVYGSVDDDTQILGFARTQADADKLARDWRYDMAVDGHCPEDAAKIAMEWPCGCGVSEPATAIRPDLAAQVRDCGIPAYATERAAAVRGPLALTCEGCGFAKREADFSRLEATDLIVLCDACQAAAGARIKAAVLAQIGAAEDFPTAPLLYCPHDDNLVEQAGAICEACQQAGEEWPAPATAPVATLTCEQCDRTLPVASFQRCLDDLQAANTCDACYVPEPYTGPRCPNCGDPVTVEGFRCTNCWLSHLRKLATNATHAPATTPVAPFAPGTRVFVMDRRDAQMFGRVAVVWASELTDPTRALVRFEDHVKGRNLYEIYAVAALELVRCLFCDGAHPGWQCPQVAAEKLRQERVERAGNGVAWHLDSNLPQFLIGFTHCNGDDRRALADAYVAACGGVSDEVLAGWVELAAPQQS